MTLKEFAKKIIASINPGTADISGIGDGTIKGAISEQNKKSTDIFQNISWNPDIVDLSCTNFIEGFKYGKIVYIGGELTISGNSDKLWGSITIAHGLPKADICTQNIATKTTNSNFYGFLPNISIEPDGRLTSYIRDTSLKSLNIQFNGFYISES